MDEQKNAKQTATGGARNVANVILAGVCGALIGHAVKSWTIGLVVTYFFIRFEVLVDAAAGTWHNTRGN